MTAIEPVRLARLRVVTYNVFQARYLDARDGGGTGFPAAAESAPGAAPASPARRSLWHDFARLPALRDADVVLLQEALVGMSRTASSVDTVAAVARCLGVDATAPAAAPGTAHTAFVGAVERARCRWGPAAVSRHPARFTPLMLPNAWWSPWPRAALVAEVGAWIVATAHLEVWPVGAGARRRQMEAILAALGRLPGHSTRPMVLAGDFNCERGGPHHVLRRHGFEAVPLASPTWALGPLRLRLDHVYLRNARAVATGIERGAQGSDHRPVWVEAESVAGAPPLS